MKKPIAKKKLVYSRELLLQYRTAAWLEDKENVSDSTGNFSPEKPIKYFQVVKREFPSCFVLPLAELEEPSKDEKPVESNKQKKRKVPRQFVAHPVDAQTPATQRIRSPARAVRSNRPISISAALDFQGAEKCHTGPGIFGAHKFPDPPTSIPNNQRWIVVETVILRSSADLSSDALARVEYGGVLEATGRIDRVDFVTAKKKKKHRQSGQVVRMEVKVMDGVFFAPLIGWVTASATGCSGGKLYVAPTGQSPTFSGFLLTVGWNFLLCDDSAIFDQSGTTVLTRLPLGTTVEQIGYPESTITCCSTSQSAKSCTCRVRVPIRFTTSFAESRIGWIFAFSAPLHPDGRNCRPGFDEEPARGIFLRPLEGEMPSGSSGRVRALTMNSLRCGVELNSQTIGASVPPGRFLEICGACVLVDFVAGEVEGKAVRAPVADGRGLITIPRWVTLSSQQKASRPTIPPVIPHYGLDDSRKLSAGASAFVPGCRIHAGVIASDAFLLPSHDGALSSWEVVYPVRGFTDPQVATCAGSFRVGSVLKQAGGCFWADHVGVSFLWMPVCERTLSGLTAAADNLYVPIMEIKRLDGTYVVYLQRQVESLQPVALSISASLNVDRSRELLRLLRGY